MKIIDISRKIVTGIPVWAGDASYEACFTSHKNGDNPSNVGSFSMSTHTGTHIDAPLHIENGGEKAGEISLLPFLGPVTVVHIPGPCIIGPVQLEPFIKPGTKRLLIRTDTWTDPAWFPESFSYFSPEISVSLKKAGVLLIGIDTPSVDSPESDKLPVHNGLMSAGIGILECLDLTGVESGAYELIALPLRLMELDASPVRAVLVIKG